MVTYFKQITVNFFVAEVTLDKVIEIEFVHRNKFNFDFLLFL